jgi:hypothetical protein
MAKGIATSLLMASLVLLLIYGVDALVVRFLALNESVRGIAFGGGSVVMSIMGLVIARREYAPIVSTLLFVNGGLIIAGMIGIIAQGTPASEDSSRAMLTVASTIAMGAVLIGLGAWKVAIDKKSVVAKGNEPAQE